MPKFKLNMDFVPIPKDFIEHIMPSANAAYVKVYMYIMLLAAEGKSAETSMIAKRLGLLETDVVNAVDYWNKRGVFSGRGDTIIIKRSVDEELAPENDKLPIEDISSIIDGDPQLRALCEMSQEMLGKTLGNNDIETIYWFYDRLGFSPEVITMLLEYCVSMGKRNMKYIEKVAITWHENNIATIEEAQAYIDRAANRNDYISSLVKLFGIEDRKLSKTEKLYLEEWRDELDMSKDMVALAYEYCIMAINKLSFPYINTILRRWAEQGIRTIQDAELDHQAHKDNGSDSGSDLKPTQGLSDIERQFMAAYSGK
ncbi:MAG: DnaD domain protein [Clostridia bacterium]|nr:DnaD domain protein [Clostridia bacterium]